RELLDWLAVRHRVTTPAQLGDRVRRVIARHDARHDARDAARDLARALRRRGVAARPDRCDGMSVVSALLTTPEAAALVAALGAHADALPHDPADGRTHGQKMADCLLDLVLRPGETDLPPVQAVLSVVAPIGALLGGDQPCEIDGQVVPAELVRALLTALTGHGLVSPTTDTGATGDGDGDGDAGPTVDDSPESDQVLLGVTAAEAARHEAEAGELAVWWAEVERRVLAGEFDAEPPPQFVDEDGPPDLAPSTDSAPHTGSHVGDGWWARADRAVDAAGTALLTAQQVLGRACRLVATAERADTADETAWRGSDAGRVTAAPDALAALAAATDQAWESLADLLGRTAGGGLADRPRIVVTDAVTGALLALTDPPRLRRAARHATGLGAPGPTDGYRPGATLDRHVRARDRRCRFPGCRRRVPRGGELDHAVPWPAGPTAAANLTGYCASHHRGKHQAPGWLHRLTLDGTLTVTTPSGMTAVTEPPPY
ncbi:HNH endonuclease signature motif containing protein, partial [Geodermatophilus normandii]